MTSRERLPNRRAAETFDLQAAELGSRGRPETPLGLALALIVETEEERR
jgi:hypothetical protein